MIDEDAIRQRWKAVSCQLDERGRRLFAAGEVRSAGWGGLAAVSKITGLARSTINRGEDDLDAAPLPKGRVRRAGGGRRAACENDPGLLPALERLVAPATLGDPNPMRPLIGRGTTRSGRRSRQNRSSYCSGYPKCGVWGAIAVVALLIALVFGGAAILS